MSRWGWPIRLVALGTLLFGTTVGLSESGMLDESELARRRLDVLRADPMQAKALNRALAEFSSLPLAEREALRRLDKYLRGQESANQARLLRLMSRYSQWAARLGPAERQRLAATHDPTERVALVRSIRQSQWLASQPIGRREQLAQLPMEERVAKIERWMKEERLRRSEWSAASRDWEDWILSQSLPIPLHDKAFREQVAHFIGILKPVMTAEEMDRYQKALSAAEKGDYLTYGRLVLDIVDHHPVQLPGPMTGPTHLGALPVEIREHLSKLPKGTNALKKAVGRWPEYGIAVTEFCRRNNIALPKPLGPATPSQFSPAIQEFIRTQLMPKLNAVQAKLLMDSQGRWPEYPRMLMDLARQHRLTIPEMSLPGDPAKWELLRNKPVGKDRNRLLGVEIGE